MKTRLFFYTLFSLFIFSFTMPAENSSAKCANQTSCSNTFRTLVVTIPVKGFINGCRTIRVQDGRVIDLSPAPQMAEKSYPLFTDAEIALTDKAGKEFYFVGLYYGHEIMREKYTIANDHGHVVITKGNVNIKLKEGC